MKRPWMPLEDWHALVGGDTCPMCGDQTADENPYSYKIALLPGGRLQLQKNQFIRGYCLLIANGHYAELHHMPERERDAFFKDMVRAGKALMRVFGADKLNYEILGNTIPHIHAHIKPRYHGEWTPARIGNSAGVQLLQPEDYHQRVKAIQAALQ